METSFCGVWTIFFFEHIIKCFNLTNTAMSKQTQQQATVYVTKNLFEFSCYLNPCRSLVQFSLPLKMQIINCIACIDSVGQSKEISVALAHWPITVSDDFLQRTEHQSYHGPFGLCVCARACFYSLAALCHNVLINNMTASTSCLACILPLCSLKDCTTLFPSLLLFPPVLPQCSLASPGSVCLNCWQRARLESYNAFILSSLISSKLDFPLRINMSEVKKS